MPIELNKKAQKPLHLFKEKDKKKPKHEGETYMVFEKYDGWYGYYQDGAIYSFSDRIIPSVQWLADKIRVQMESIGATGRIIFEILVHGYPEFHILNGMLNRKKEPCKLAYLMVHDYIPKTDNYTNIERYGLSKRIVKALDLPMVYSAPLLEVTSCEFKWQRHCDFIWKQGGEGVILKLATGHYKWGGRDYTMLKIKEEVTVDLLVTDLQEGEGRLVGHVGALVCKDKAGNTHYIAGLTDEVRYDWWRDPSQIVGKVVEVKAMKVLKDGSLREPRFKAIRHDKGAEDID